jgi:hypothetical protein
MSAVEIEIFLALVVGYNDAFGGDWGYMVKRIHVK